MHCYLWEPDMKQDKISSFVTAYSFSKFVEDDLRQTHHLKDYLSIIHFKACEQGTNNHHQLANP